MAKTFFLLSSSSIVSPKSYSSATFSPPNSNLVSQSSSVLIYRDSTVLLLPKSLGQRLCPSFFRAAKQRKEDNPWVSKIPIPRSAAHSFPLPKP
ncbi:hypothetical protein M6B38_214025 [Iris pallida]|uniref:Uncharacterized protein n=1 Tax=Iris pallida TaxID=29817 RepID=A0AAX6E2H0_IRIPA|nr:hypothetical protein M6B38_214015 [Iris pallida]KAJ6798216.1 hypothetical protein M6B38_214020 [Iris pallida]KAJ6798217.1 hypothetical protein M6B38_214025 [Iris pallida]